MKRFTLATVFVGTLLIADHSVGSETVCNFSVVLEPGQIEKCETLSSPEATTSCLNKLFGSDWTISLHDKRLNFKSAKAAAKYGLRLCFGKASFSVVSHEIQIYRFPNEKKFRISGIKPGTVSNIEIRSGEQACGLNENGEMLLSPDRRLINFLPIRGQIATKGFRCENDKEYNMGSFSLLEPASFCSFKAAKSTDFFERTTGFWHFVAENSGTLTYKEANGKTVRVKIKDGEDYHIKRPDLNPCKWEKSSKELLDPSWID